MKEILFICPYPENKAPSQRLKFEQYFDLFAENGFNCKLKSFISVDFWKIVYLEGYLLQKVKFTFIAYLKRLILLFTIRKYDVVYIHLWVTPFGPPVFEFLVCILAKKIIFDIDDMVYLGHSSSANRFFQKLKGRYKMIYLMKKANHVITCTPKLDEFVRKYNANTTDISSTINTEIYLPKLSTEIKNEVILGWSGSHSTSKYLKLLEPVFIELLEMKINFKVLIIGDENFQFDNKKIPFQAIKWSHESEVEDLKKIDIGLYPLPNEAWVFGKSGLKALQYMSLGIPTIAQAIGANFRIIENEINGFLVSKNSEWVTHINLLIKDKSLRDFISVNGVMSVNENYSLKTNVSKYLNVFEKND